MSGKKKKVKGRHRPKKAVLRRARQITRPLGLAPSGSMRTGVHFHAHQLPFGAPILVQMASFPTFIYITSSSFHRIILAVCILIHGFSSSFHSRSIVCSLVGSSTRPTRQRFLCSSLHLVVLFILFLFSHRPPVSVPAGLAVLRWRRWT